MIIEIQQFRTQVCQQPSCKGDIRVVVQVAAEVQHFRTPLCQQTQYKGNVRVTKCDTSTLTCDALLY